MIREQIVHLKNVIIFKILIYLLCVIFFSILAPIANSNIISSLRNISEAQKELTDLRKKIELVKNEKTQIYDAYKLYLDAVNSNFDVECFIKDDLNKDYIQIASNIGLQEIPRLFCSAAPDVQSFNNSRYIETSSTKLMTQFKSRTIQESIDFIRLCYEQIPLYKTITSFDISLDDSITPNSIRRLSPNITPSLISSSANMYIKEIKVTHK